MTRSFQTKNIHYFFWVVRPRAKKFLVERETTQRMFSKVLKWSISKKIFSGWNIVIVGLETAIIFWKRNSSYVYTRKYLKCIGVQTLSKKHNILLVAEYSVNFFIKPREVFCLNQNKWCRNE